VRDKGLVEAALLRPQTGYYNDLIEEAAALWESLAMNHGFIDGNKRIAFAAMDIFLDLNSLKITASQEEATDFVYRHLETGTFSKDNLDEWLRVNTKAA
jgi:death-on-curing protein